MLEGRIGQDACRLRRPLNHADPHRKSLRYCVCHHPHNHALDAVIIRLADLRLYAFAGQRFLRRWFIANQPTRSRARINWRRKLGRKSRRWKAATAGGKREVLYNLRRERQSIPGIFASIERRHYAAYGSRRLRCLEAAAARRPSAARPPLERRSDHRKKPPSRRSC
jgi:hypothetical protein